MMVIDTSAVVAILLGEPEAPLFARRIAADPTRLMSAMSALEAAIVMQERKARPYGLAPAIKFSAAARPRKRSCGVNRENPG